MSFAKLDELGHKLEALEHALAILGADEATHMAVGGGEKRAEAMAVARRHASRQATAPEIADWIDAAENEALSEEQAAAVREFRRQLHQSDLPARPSSSSARPPPRMRSRAAVARPAGQERLGGFPAGAGRRRRAGARGSAASRRRARPRPLRRADGAVRSRPPRRRHHAGVRRAEGVPQGLRAGGAGRAGRAAGEVAAEAAFAAPIRSTGSANSASP